MESLAQMESKLYKIFSGAFSTISFFLMGILQQNNSSKLRSLINK